MQSPFDLIELILFKAQEKKIIGRAIGIYKAVQRHVQILLFANWPMGLIPFVMIITGVTHAFERFISSFLFLHTINFIKP
jgi:hypothetical protein